MGWPFMYPGIQPPACICEIALISSESVMILWGAMTARSARWIRPS